MDNIVHTPDWWCALCTVNISFKSLSSYLYFALTCNRHDVFNSHIRAAYMHLYIYVHKRVIHTISGHEKLLSPLISNAIYINSIVVYMSTYVQFTLYITYNISCYVYRRLYVLFMFASLSYMKLNIMHRYV